MTPQYPAHAVRRAASLPRLCAHRLLLPLALLSACSPAASGAPDASVALDTPAAIDAGPVDAGLCDVAPTPSGVPTLVGTFVPLTAAVDAGPGGADAGDLDAGTSAFDAGDLDASAPSDAGPSDAGSPPPGPPVPRGGDPIGTWRFERATFFTGPGSAGMYDPAGSSIAGTAWAVVGATDIRFEFDFDITLQTTIAGTIRRRQTTRVVATYAVAGTSLVLTPTCAEGGGTGMGAGLSFTAEAGTGVLITRLTGMLGETIIVLEGTREP